jgi:hypothetical protein
MDYESRIAFHGEAERSFDLAMTILSSVGFRVVARDDARLEAEGAGMNSTRESPLTGASRVRIVHRHGEFQLEAELGGARKMCRFVALFPPALGLGLAAFFAVLFGVIIPEASPWTALIPLLAVSPWPLIAPILSRHITRRTVRALDTLLSNMASAT